MTQKTFRSFGKYRFPILSAMGIGISFFLFAQMPEPRPDVVIDEVAPADPVAPAVPYEGFLDPNLADGFDFPIGNVDGQGKYTHKGKTYNGWYIAVAFCEQYSYGIHNGEDFNGRGGGDTDLGQPVYSIGHGKVTHVTHAEPFGNIVTIEHRYIDNGIIRSIFSQYDHLKEVQVKAGDAVKRRQKIGTIGKGANEQFLAHLHFEIRKEAMRDKDPTFWPSSNGWTVEQVQENFHSPSEFIRNHRSLPHPPTAKNFLICFKADRTLHLFSQGKIASSWQIAVSQEPIGKKSRDGDLKTPEGFYHIREKIRGPFAGPDWMKFLGVAWMRIDYPNRVDAQEGLKEKAITQTQYNAIVKAIAQKKMPPKGTPLGDGIGIHGWADPDWALDGNRALTWGCISMQKKDLLDLYEKIPIGTPIIIHP